MLLTAVVILVAVVMLATVGRGKRAPATAAAATLSRGSKRASAKRVATEACKSGGSSNDLALFDHSVVGSSLFNDRFVGVRTIGF